MFGHRARKPSIFLVNWHRRDHPPGASSHAFCVGTFDLASVSTSVRPVSDNVRRTTPIVSANLRRKPPLIARRAVYVCAPLQIPADAPRRGAPVSVDDRVQTKAVAAAGPRRAATPWCSPGYRPHRSTRVRRARPARRCRCHSRHRPARQRAERRRPRLGRSAPVRSPA
jgi:hypothetical protein